MSSSARPIPVRGWGYVEVNARRTETNPFGVEHPIAILIHTLPLYKIGGVLTLSPFDKCLN